ncbi:MAG: hypothetical protein LC646_08860 [Xanthomonadaceae bacterium]|nr:hypothetical protein [Xanthomonadaceae bacterium]
MILILAPDTERSSDEFRQLMAYLDKLPNIQARLHEEFGAQQSLTEIYLIGDTATLSIHEMEALPAVERAVKVSQEYRVLGRHRDDQRSTHFDYNGVRFGQDNLNVFAGLCAVSNPEHVEGMLRALQAQGQVCTRMGAYKPRTSPYAFQGHGKACLPYVFELAGKYGIKVIAMEVTHESHVEEIHSALEQTGNPTGVMLQIGLKRGFGITLEESLNAAEYLASEGNRRVVFGLRGMKTNMGDPHRNLVDFAHVPVVKRLTRMPVCIDPSHSVGTRDRGPDGILDVFQVTAQGVVAGANMILVDFHPEPGKALVDGPQALRLDELEYFLEDVRMARETYEARVKLASRHEISEVNE